MLPLFKKQNPARGRKQMRSVFVRLCFKTFKNQNPARGRTRNLRKLN